LDRTGASSRWNGENIHGALEVVGDGGEVDLGGVGETSPSHPSKAVTALPGSEDLLDPATHAMDRLISFMKLAQDFLFVTAPHAGGDDPRNAAFRTDSVTEITEMIAAIGAVGKHLTRIVGQGFRACLAVIDIGGCDREFLDQRRIGIGANVGLGPCTARFPLCFTQRASSSSSLAEAMMVASTGVCRA